MGKIKFCLLSLPFAAASWVAVAEPGAGEPVVVLQRSLKTPTVSYHGQIVSTRWADERSKTEEIVVHFRPPNMTRWEYLKPDGRVDRIVVSDGTEEQLQLFPVQKSLKCKAAKSCSKQMTHGREWELLLNNYQVNLIGFETVAGRKTQILQLTPLMEGKPIQRLWVDEGTGIILGVKRFRPRSEMATLSKFIEFAIGSSLPAESFQIAGVEVDSEERWLDPNFLSMDSFMKMTGRPAPLPIKLPMGFELESADYFVLNGKRVNHFRYTDGLNVISVFETPNPTRFSSPSHAVGRPTGRGSPAAGNRIYRGKVRENHLTLVGDVSNDVLEKIYLTFGNGN